MTAVSGGFPAVRRGRRWCAELRRGRRRAAAAAAAAWRRRRRRQRGGVLPIPWRGVSVENMEKSHGKTMGFLWNMLETLAVLQGFNLGFLSKMGFNVGNIVQRWRTQGDFIAQNHEK